MLLNSSPKFILKIGINYVFQYEICGTNRIAITIPDINDGFMN